MRNRFNYMVIDGLLLNVFILFITNCQIIKPVAHLRDILRDISQGKGDLTRRVPVNATDELGQASGYFNTLMENLQVMIREIKDVSCMVMDKSGVASNEIATVASNTSLCADSARDAAATTEHISTSSLQIVGNVQSAHSEANSSICCIMVLIVSTRPFT